MEKKKKVPITILIEWLTSYRFINKLCIYIQQQKNKKSNSCSNRDNNFNNNNAEQGFTIQALKLSRAKC